MSNNRLRFHFDRINTMALLKLLSLLFICFLIACSPSESQFDIRDANRPEYLRTLSVEDLSGFIDKGGVVIDVRLQEDFDMDSRLIPGALRGDPENLENWITDHKGKPIAVYCVKGKWVSQKVAAHASDLKYDVFSLEGGLAAYDRSLRD